MNAELSIAFAVLCFVTHARSAHTITGGTTIGSDNIGDTLVRFNDRAHWSHGRITAIRMLCGQYLLALSIQYNGQWAPQHGFWNPECATNQTWTPVYSFGPDEWITRASLTGEAYVSSVTFTTNKQQSLETCGIPATSTTSISVLEGGKLEYVTGMSGCYFDRLQLHWSDFGNFIG
ncbi:zymogen granule membrane protein 16-like [Mya arenaria]|uniref:zymogen granule membrane protein 16-like n=1 Tax=Mya arenaria TaxID=6604 RepID=UPI0022E01252|nr:zymogen granule membrane protein 16-like [Mya arenaria]